MNVVDLMRDNSIYKATYAWPSLAKILFFSNSEKNKQYFPPTSGKKYFQKMGGGRFFIKIYDPCVH